MKTNETLPQGQVLQAKEDFIASSPSHPGPTYNDRVKTKAVLDFCNTPCDTYKKYDNSMRDSLFHGLNTNDDSAQFNAILINEAEAFTINMRDVVVISRHKLKRYIDLKKTPESIIDFLFQDFDKSDKGE